MDLKKIEGQSTFIKITLDENGKEAGRAYLYLIKNNLHEEPYGLLEDVFVEEKYRGQGLGTKLMKEIIAEAKKHSCYKLIATSRESRTEVHQWYEKLGFKKHGVEFRMDF